MPILTIGQPEKHKIAPKPNLRSVKFLHVPVKPANRYMIHIVSSVFELLLETINFVQLRFFCRLLSSYRTWRTGNGVGLFHHHSLSRP